MTAFSLEEFVANPTLERLGVCKKTDLFAIAKHYGFSASSSLVKAELRAVVTDGLVQRGVVSSLDLPAGAAAKQSGPVVEEVATPHDVTDTPGVKRGEGKQFTLPRYNPLSVESSSTSGGDARLKVRLARLHLEKEREREYQFRRELELKKIEVESTRVLELKKLEAETAIRMRELELQSAQFPAAVADTVSSGSNAAGNFDCKLSGKAQEACSSLSVQDSLSYKKVKNAILQVYELVPEAYRQRFRALRKGWVPRGGTADDLTEGCDIVNQVVVPVGWRPYVLGTCQIVGKPNQVVPPAPLHPIPAVGEPFEHVIVDCIGPLPRTKLGNQFLLTVMCVSTRFPEAVPLRNITAPAVTKSLIKFFGLPKVVQTDQGTNFLSKIFRQTMQELGISHSVSSAYHPESQGALERWHQTLKSTLKKFCYDTERDWDEGVPYVLFAVRNAKQESLGFSPTELVFGHSVRGPLKVLKEQLVSRSLPKVNVLDFVSRNRERLHRATSLAKKALALSQEGMKQRFDRKTVEREFKPGEQVLVLLPVLGAALTARFSGPYVVENKVSETDYIIHTPDRKRKKRLCHVNMLKSYHSREVAQGKQEETPETTAPGENVASLVCDRAEPDDGLAGLGEGHQGGRLPNSGLLSDLEAHLSYLSPDQRDDVMLLITSHLSLFSDVPSQTTVMCHDINIGTAAPIKQHAYRCPLAKREMMKEEVDYLIRNGLARPSCSPWSSPCLLTPKSDGTLRFCTDFRKVNAVTVPDSFPLPRMEDCIDSIGPAEYITKLDLLKGYWQVPLTPRASDISAFVTPDHFMQYTVMAFGLRNAPATFQRMMHIVLGTVSNCNVYLDDVVVYTNDWTSFMSILTEVFQRLAAASLTLNLAKCEFGKAIVTYLGKQVGHGQVNHSQAVNMTPTQPWIVVHDDGTILVAHCTCKAGLGEACSHAAALMYAVLAAVNLKDGLSSTEMPCAWVLPSKTGKVQYEEISNISFMKKTVTYSPLPSIPIPTEEEYMEFYQKLYECDVQEESSKGTAILSVIEGHSHRYKPKTLQLNLPEPLSKLYSKAKLHADFASLLVESESIFDNLQITEQEMGKCE
ncbi:unnamed protein product [Leuciscus chuanchicus]